MAPEDSTRDVDEIDRGDTDAQKAQPTLGRRLKALRASRGLSLKEVAAETGLSASFISMVETGRNEITVGRLVTMADFYEVGLSDLIPGRDKKEPVVLRRDRRSISESPDRRVRTEMLASWNHGDMTGGFVHFDVAAELTETTPHAGPEFVTVLSGQLAIEFSDDTSVVLREGDSVWFEASRKHRYVNIGDGTAHIISFKGASAPSEI